MKLPLVIALLAAPVLAQPLQDTRPALEQYNLDKKGIALEGYDPVAYFEVGGSKARKGDSKITLEHAGITYRFASEENRSRFAESPSSFEPAYGGWCAYAMAKGDKVEIDPKSYLIEDGKLLVFYKGLLNDTRKKWRKEGSAKLKPKADKNWQKIAGVSRNLEHFNLRNGLALSGFDPVSYFSGSSPAKGGADASSEHEGVTYRFASVENRKSFERAPAKFEPQYGGYCAWAMAQGKKVEVDPTAFTLTDGKLMLFYNADKRDEWIANTARLHANADEQWSKLNGSR